MHCSELRAYQHRSQGTVGYTGIVEVQPGKLLYVYDRHDAYPEYDGKQTTAVHGVYVTVSKKD